MSKPSSIEKLDPRIREEIAIQRAAGHTIDEILAAIRELGAGEISRSALGRHIKGMDRASQMARQARMIAEVVARQFGDGNISRLQRANIEMLQSTFMDLLVGDEDGEIAKKLKSDPKAMHDLAKSLDHLSRAAKTDADYEKQVEERVEARLRKEAQANITAVAKKQGLSKETAAAIMAGAFGVKS